MMAFIVLLALMTIAPKVWIKTSDKRKILWRKLQNLTMTKKSLQVIEEFSHIQAKTTIQDKRERDEEDSAEHTRKQDPAIAKISQSHGILVSSQDGVAPTSFAPKNQSQVQKPSSVAQFEDHDEHLNKQNTTKSAEPPIPESGRGGKIQHMSGSDANRDSYHTITPNETHTRPHKKARTETDVPGAAAALSNNTYARKRGSLPTTAGSANQTHTSHAPAQNANSFLSPEANVSNAQTQHVNSQTQETQKRPSKSNATAAEQGLGRSARKRLGLLLTMSKSSGKQNPTISQCNLPDMDVVPNAYSKEKYRSVSMDTCVCACV